MSNYVFNTKSELLKAITEVGMVKHRKTHDPQILIKVEEYGPMNTWDVSRIDDMSNLFSSSSEHMKPYNNQMFEEVIFNEDISTWNVSNVTNMQNMFYGCIEFNQPLKSWNVSNVTNMSWMFCVARSFNQPLGHVDDAHPGWNVSNVTNMRSMFENCTAFNQPLNSWNVSNVTIMTHMFNGAKSFNQPLDSWNVSSMTDMNCMFCNCDSLSVGNLAYTFYKWNWNKSSSEIKPLFENMYNMQNREETAQKIQNIYKEISKLASTIASNSLNKLQQSRPRLDATIKTNIFSFIEPTKTQKYAEHLIEKDKRDKQRNNIIKLITKHLKTRKSKKGGRKTRNKKMNKNRNYKISSILSNSK